jgi:5-hydroxyisourate hydrolase
VTRPAGISIHVVDVSRGVIAQGLVVRVDRLDGERRVTIVEAPVGAGGTVSALDALAAQFSVGVYEASFRVGDYYRARGEPLPAVPFLDVVPFRFGIADARQHYHLPLKMTPWGFSCFRGGA